MTKNILPWLVSKDILSTSPLCHLVSKSASGDGYTGTCLKGTYSLGLVFPSAASIMFSFLQKILSCFCATFNLCLSLDSWWENLEENVIQARVFLCSRNKSSSLRYIPFGFREGHPKSERRHYSPLKDIPSLLHHKEREFDFRSVVKLGCASLEHKEAAVQF